jgi:hypothetical protein
MKIIKRQKKEIYKFVVIRQFVWDKKIAEIGSEIEIKERSDQDGMVQRGMVKPSDLPEIGLYISLRDITLPGKVEKFTAKKLELIELKDSDALKLMLAQSIVPHNPDQWRPYSLKLGAPKRDYRGEAQIAEAERRAGIKALEKELSNLKARGSRG